jgi:hypothetical protein
MRKKLPWLKFDMMQKEFKTVILEKEKISKKKMEEAARVWNDAKGPIEYVHTDGFIYSVWEWKFLFPSRCFGIISYYMIYYSS